MDQKTSFRRQMRFVFFLVFVVFLKASLAQAKPVELAPDTGTLNLGPLMGYVEDKKGDMGFSQLMLEKNDKLWQQNSRDVLAFGYTDSAYWVKGEFVNAGATELSLLVEVAYPVLDHITVFIVRDGEREEFELGDKLPFSNRPIEHRNFLFRLKLAAKEQATLVLRVKTSSAMQIPLYIHNEIHFLEKNQTVMMGLGLYYGAMIIMIIYNLFVFFSVREVNYLYYVIYVACMAMFVTSLNGTSYHYLWPDSVWWNDQVLVVSLNGVVIFAILFTVGFLKVKETRPKIHWFFVFLAMLSAGVVLFSLKIPYRTGILATIALAVVAIVGCMTITILRWVEGYQSARFYGVAWCAIFFGGVILALNKVGFIPRNVFTENATLYGSVLEVVLLSFALADRLNIEKKERIEAQNIAHIQERNARIANENALHNERKAREAREHALEIQKKATETLEQRVEERTHELNETLDIVREVNNQILSSLRYARMIQLSMLPQSEKIKEFLSGHFIWWQPRDIVGGDFYYIDAIEPGCIVAVADCTGHGVPGAFMTIIASSELKRIVRGEGCYDPGEILTRLNRRIKKTLKQDTSSAISDDGLDIGICVIRIDEGVIDFAGARMDLICTTEDAVYTTHGNRNSVGYVSLPSDIVYPGQRIPLVENMTFYLCTDGIFDQPGERSGRRFGTRRLREIIFENRGQTLECQFERLKAVLDKHRASRDQVDDMTMVAFRPDWAGKI